MYRLGRLLGLWALALILSASLPHLSLAQVRPPSSELYKGLEYRLVGPFRGGRASSVAGVPSQPDMFYMGATGGGVWKTTDSGETWVNVSDGYFKSGSVGAMAVAESDPNVVYVGMGEACIRGNVSPGDGVYKSTDAGKSWKHVGLESAGQIGRVRVHPRDPDLVYVAVFGHAFGPNPERGVFRSKNGGMTWEKVLFVSEKAGAVDLAMDATNPRILYAAIWQAVRQPWTIISGGEDSGLYKSVDGGDTWTKLTAGLPEGIKGRIGVAVSPANPNRVWALVEAAEGGLFRSEDGGKTFTRINKDRTLRTRAFYFTHVFAHPRHPDTVYVHNIRFLKSVDGGKTFEPIEGSHGDHHDLWINPHNPSIMIQANDGGATVSRNGGLSWSTQANQPTAEFYRVSTDNRFLYRLYGAQQDNTTVSIPSRTTTFGITERDWYPVGGGEQGYVVPDPRNPNIVYAAFYEGQIERYDHSTGQVRNVEAYPQLVEGQAPRDLRYRFQMNAPIRVSPHDPNVVYNTANYVLKSSDQGETWRVVSPDLTRNDKSKQDYAGGPITWDNTGPEVYDTIFAFEESPLQAGLLWAGTDDGLVHISRDRGGHWENVTPAAMPEWGTVDTLDLSAHDPGRAFIAVHRYRLDDFKPYVFRTDDYGKSWKLLTSGGSGIPANHFVRVIREDPTRKGLLYAGTEFGLYVSFNDGMSWQSLQLNLPIVPIKDLVIKNGDLVVATQGRAFWIFDDLTPLRQLTEEVARAKAHLFTPREAYRVEGSRTNRPKVGKNPPNGAAVYYYFAEAQKEPVKLEFLDSAGRVIGAFSSKDGEGNRVSAGAGMNRCVWDLRYPDAGLFKGAILYGHARGMKAVPGDYQVRITAGSWSETRPLTIKKDPRLATTQADFQQQFDLALRIRDRITETHQAVLQIRELRRQVQDYFERLKKAGKEAGLAEAVKQISEKLTAVEEKLTQTKLETGLDTCNFPPQLDNQIARVYEVVTDADARPTPGAIERFADLEAELSGHLRRLREIIETEVTAFNALARERGVPAVLVPTGS